MDVVLIRSRTRLPAALACVLALAPTHAPRADEWAVCAPSSLPPAPPAGRQSTTIEADSATLREDGVSVAEGNVILRTPERTITSHRMNYDEDAGRAEASGEVTVREREVFLEGHRLRANLKTGETVMDKAGFTHPDSHGRGEADRIETTPGTTVITDGSFTTCDPGSNAWRLEAKSLELDHESGIGTAHHARLKVLGIPILYTPWISFPIGSDRKSGLLAPSFGMSGKAGTSLTLPLYLNLAPNYDATLTPRWVEQRGFGLETEFGHKSRWSDTQLDTAFLSGDRDYDGELSRAESRDSAGEFWPSDRWSLQIDHLGRNGGLRTDVDFATVS